MLRSEVGLLFDCGRKQLVLDMRRFPPFTVFLHPLYKLLDLVFMFFRSKGSSLWMTLECVYEELVSAFLRPLVVVIVLP